MQVSGAERIWVLRGRGVRAVIPRRDISNVVLAVLHPRYAVAALLEPQSLCNLRARVALPLCIGFSGSPPRSGRNCGIPPQHKLRSEDRRAER
jgi:hypothetical protein